jgi:hypothetical protein
MANALKTLPVPDTGQPFDVSYVYGIVETINEIVRQIQPTNNRFTVIKTPSDTSSVLTSGARIHGEYVETFSEESVSAGDEKTFEINLTGFSKPPVVTATPYNISDAVAGNNVSIILKSVTTSKVVGVVRANVNGKISIGVNVIAVGIPK